MRHPLLEKSSPITATFVLPVFSHSILSLDPQRSCEITPLLEGETYLWSLLALNGLCCVLWETCGAQAVLMGPVCNAAPGCLRSQMPSSPSHHYRGAHAHSTFTLCPGGQQLCLHPGKLL